VLNFYPTTLLEKYRPQLVIYGLGLEHLGLGLGLDTIGFIPITVSELCLGTLFMIPKTSTLVLS